MENGPGIYVLSTRNPCTGFQQELLLPTFRTVRMSFLRLDCTPCCCSLLGAVHARPSPCSGLHAGCLAAAGQDPP
eukprot:16446233-Heterocapsa_arctica.AAC.1